ncbi:hypothetical protein [Aeromicrobium sp.]|uniref:cupredoxin domain-containing protein n=1 Tax=Aeromicrobium sp. TaxID=1871063 RepID=UPI001994DC53|nr:hypothetical protein [Aeromicrobium sp.]MBC7631503.1 hypothetical protein [Aeromicrobium sp.]
MSRAVRTTVLIVAALAALTGCSGSESSGSSDGAAGSSASKEGGATDTPSTNTPSTDAGNPVLVGITDNPATTMAMRENGFTPDTVTIKVGDVVELTSGDDLVHSIVAGTLPGMSVAKDLPEYYRFDRPGTYTMTDEINEHTATVMVK